MAMMNLTRMYQSPEDYVPPLSAEVLEDHEEMELLLEAYLQVGEGLQAWSLAVWNFAIKGQSWNSWVLL